MWRHLRRHPELLEPEYGLAYVNAESRRAVIGPIVYGFAIPVAFVAPLVALLLYLGLAILYAVTNQGVSRE